MFQVLFSMKSVRNISLRSMKQYYLLISIVNYMVAIDQSYSMPDTGQLNLNSSLDPESKLREQSQFVKQMMKHSWNSYVEYAWGLNELEPISKNGTSTYGYLLGTTIVDSLGTLHIMNMTDELKKARDWVENNLNFDSVDTELSVFYTNIKLVGGLLSAFALTNDKLYADKAKHIVDKLLPAFNTLTGIALERVNPKTGQAFDKNRCSVLSEIGALHLEFLYLSAITGNEIYGEKVCKMRNHLDRMEKPYGGLYNVTINPNTGEFCDNKITLGALGDIFYEYLVKSWFQSNGTDNQAFRMYEQTFIASDRYLVRKSKSGLTYLISIRNNKEEHRMQHFACSFGGMFALGSLGLKNETMKKHFLDLGANVTFTCQESYRRTATQLGPPTFAFNSNGEAMADNKNDLAYSLRTDVIQSYFYLWRLTHDQRYRDYAWSAAQAIRQHCYTGNGFVGILNISDIKSGKIDRQSSHFMSETLKYLYLIFSSDDLIPFSKWVFNTEGHPLPIVSNLNCFQFGETSLSTFIIIGSVFVLIIILAAIVLIVIFIRKKILRQNNSKVVEKEVYDNINNYYHNPNVDYDDTNEHNDYETVNYDSIEPHETYIEIY